MDTQTNRHTDASRQTETDTQTLKYTDTERHTDRHVEREIVTQIDK